MTKLPGKDVTLNSFLCEEHSLKEASWHMRHRQRPLPQAGSQRQTRVGLGRSLCRGPEKGLAPFLTLLLT